MKPFLFLFNDHTGLAYYVASFAKPADAETAARLMNEELSFGGVSYHVVRARSRRDAATQAAKLVKL